MGVMSPTARFFRLILTISALIVGPAEVKARADMIMFEFTGVCADCSGTGVGELILSNYTPGQNITNSNFVSFSYTSNLFSYSVGFTPWGDQLGAISGMLGSGWGSFIDIVAWGLLVDLQDVPTPPIVFVVSPSGNWCVGVNCGEDNGPASSWDVVGAVPEPANVIPVALGVSAICLYRRRRQK
jgi:hypothetical protein